ncbi:DUF86 domain-containing protein [Clostridia bacterium]|nr:DUF86 domain-containing protein [Clostridia bacterium]
MNNKSIILHILEHIELIQQFAHEYDSFESFQMDVKGTSACIFHLMQIGELMNMLDVSFKTDHPEVMWQDIINMRHRIVHHYSDINYSIVWLSIQNDLPELLDQMRKLI